MQTPRTFGEAIRSLRRLYQQPVDEVSERIGISSDELRQIEDNHRQPTEETVWHVISLYELSSQAAVTLWKLASLPEENLVTRLQLKEKLHALGVGFLPQAPALYTDMIHVSANQFGVIIDFMQNNPSGEPFTLSRIGMSAQHAASLIVFLGKALEAVNASETPPPRQLNAGTDL